MILKPAEIRKDILEKKKDHKKTFPTALGRLDDYIKLAKGYFMVVTGYPSSGKSEVVDAILMNMALLYGWKTIFYSPENWPISTHVIKHIERYVGKEIEHASKSEIETGIDFCNEHFTWIANDNPTIDEVLSLIESDRLPKQDVLVIDPWNGLNHDYTQERMSHRYLEKTLSKISSFARRNNILVIIVAHPKNPQRTKEGIYLPPTLYEISDGAMWRNKCDYGVVVHREDLTSNETTIYIQKIKQKWMGQCGVTTLEYHLESGRYKGDNQYDFSLPKDREIPF